MNTQNKRTMKLGCFMPAPGHHIAAWRHPSCQPDGGLDIEYYCSLAQKAEEGLFDMIFLSDGVGVRTHYRNNDELSRQGRTVHFEPLTLLSAIAMVTQRIGLVATASTSYNEPFHIARKYASLDYISHGRAGWNVVTSVTDVEAQNFNLEKQADHEERYQRSREFMDVVTGLWDSWEDDAFICDKASGHMFDPNKLHILNHKGDYFSVRGPLNVARPKQGYPVIVQAGSSKTGRDFAAQWAEVIFTAQTQMDDATAFYKDIKAQAKAYGRKEHQLHIMPGVTIVVGETDEEANQKFQVLQDLIDPVVSLSLLESQLGDIDLSRYDIDGYLPPLPQTEGSTSRQRLIWEKAQRENLTIRELARSIAGSRGHHLLIGSPKTIVDTLQEWFEAGAADGFNIMPPVNPEGLDDIVKLVVPELQRRGLFRTEYHGSTLRDHLGLERPEFASAKKTKENKQYAELSE
jgi:alkanesulfonate monooxygenase